VSCRRGLTDFFCLQVHYGAIDVTEVNRVYPSAFEDGKEVSTDVKGLDMESWGFYHGMSFPQIHSTVRRLRHLPHSMH
jgi:hypothetical protein